MPKTSMKYTPIKIQQLRCSDKFKLTKLFPFQRRSHNRRKRVNDRHQNASSNDGASPPRRTPRDSKKLVKRITSLDKFERLFDNYSKSLHVFRFYVRQSERYCVVRASKKVECQVTHCSCRIIVL